MTVLLAAVMIWFYADGQIQTSRSWDSVPTIGVQYITVCGRPGPDGKPIRRRFAGGDFYCNTSPYTEDGWDQSLWIDGKHELLHVFLKRSGCTPESVKLGLMIDDETWDKTEQEASLWECD